MDVLNTVQILAILAIPVLFAITAHEAAHGWAANRLGDHTATMLGRVSFNPLKHIDPVGTVLVPIGIFLISSAGGAPFLFGWAKPVPVDWRNLRHPRRDMALVAVAGPGANLLMAIFWGLTIRLGIALWGHSEWLALPLIYMGAAGVLINVLLMLVNLVPLPPLDGGRVMTALLPPRLAQGYARLEPFGLIILLVLLVTGALGEVLLPFLLGTIAFLPGAGVVKELFFT